MYITDDTKRLYQQWTDADPASEYIHPDLRWYVSTGSFVKTLLTNKQISGYGEVSEYDPQPMGYMVAKIRDGKLASVEPIATD